MAMLEIYQMAIMSMKGTRTSGRKSMPSVMRGKLEPEPSQTLKMKMSL